MPWGAAPEAKGPVAGATLLMPAWHKILNNHEPAALRVGAVELACLRNGSLCLQLHTQHKHLQMSDSNCPPAVFVVAVLQLANRSCANPAYVC